MRSSGFRRLVVRYKITDLKSLDLRPTGTSPRQKTQIGLQEEMERNLSQSNLSTMPSSWTSINHSAIFQGCMLVLALLGNILVLLALKLSKCKIPTIKRMRFFMAHICLADVLVALLHLLPNVIEFAAMTSLKVNAITCRLRHYFALVPLYGSTYVMFALVADRYLAACHPLLNMTLRKSSCAVLLAWAVAMLASIPNLVCFEMVTLANGEAACYQSSMSMVSILIMTVFLFLAMYAVPFLAAICCYVFMLLKPRQREMSPGDKEMRPDSTDNLMTEPGASLSGPGLDAATTRSIWMTCAASLVYFLCQTPYMVCLMWDMFGKNPPWESLPFSMAFLSLPLKSCSSPLVYMAFNAGAICRRFFQ